MELSCYSILVPHTVDICKKAAVAGFRLRERKERVLHAPVDQELPFDRRSALPGRKARSFLSFSHYRYLDICRRHLQKSYDIYSVYRECCQRITSKPCRLFAFHSEIRDPFLHRADDLLSFISRLPEVPVQISRYQNHCRSCRNQYDSCDTFGRNVLYAIWLFILIYLLTRLLLRLLVRLLARLLVRLLTHLLVRLLTRLLLRLLVRLLLRLLIRHPHHVFCVSV